MTRMASVLLIALSAGLMGCSPTPGESASGGTSTQGTATPATRTDVEDKLDCYLVDNENYSAGKGQSARAAVAALEGWYPPISRTTRWSGTDAADADTEPALWVLYTEDGRGYGTATVSQADPRVPEWTAAVNQLCVTVVPPIPSHYTDLTADGRSTSASLGDPVNAAFAEAMSSAIVGRSEADAADALRAVGWRVRVSERDGVGQENAGSSSSWINLAIADETVTGFTIG